MTDNSQHSPGHRGDQHDEKTVMYGLKRRLTSPPWLARTAGVGLSSVSIGFVVLFVFVLETGGDLTLFMRPLPMQIALVLPYLIVVLAFGTAVGALLGWRYRYWTFVSRIHQTILALLGLAFSWQLSTLGFLTL